MPYLKPDWQEIVKAVEDWYDIIRFRIDDLNLSAKDVHDLFRPTAVIQNWCAKHGEYNIPFLPFRNFLTALETRQTPENYVPAARVSSKKMFEHLHDALTARQAICDLIFVDGITRAKLARGAARLKAIGTPPSPKDRFKCESSRVLFDGGDIGIPVGHAVSVFHKLRDRFGQIVPHERLDAASSPGKGSDQLRQSITAIKERIRARRLPCTVVSKRGQGYGLMSRD